MKKLLALLLVLGFSSAFAADMKAEAAPTAKKMVKHHTHKHQHVNTAKSAPAEAKK